PDDVVELARTQPGRQRSALRESVLSRRREEVLSHPRRLPHPPCQMTFHVVSCPSSLPPETETNVCGRIRSHSDHQRPQTSEPGGFFMGKATLAEQFDVIVREQHGLVTTGQAERLLGPNRKARWIAQGRLFAVQPAVFRVNGASDMGHSSVKAAQLSSDGAVP